MPRSVALTGLIIIVSLAAAGFAAFSSDETAPQTGMDVAEIDASVAAAVFAAPLVPRPQAVLPTTTTTPRLLRPNVLEVAPTEPPTTTTTTPPTTTSAPPPTTTTTKAPPTTSTTPPTTAAPATTVPAATTPPTTAVTSTTTASASEWPPAVEQWRGLVSSYFSGARIEEALAIISCESNGDPSETNPSSGAAGLFQFIRSTWDWVAGEAGLASYASGAPYDPTANTAAAAWLVQRSIDTNHPKGPWGHWNCRRVLG